MGNPIMEEQSHEQNAQKRPEFGLNPNAPSFSMQQYPQQHNGRRTSGGPNMRYIPMESPMMMMQPVLVNPPRRFGHAELAMSGLALPPNVIRMPRGPDKGKGFARWCNSRMKPGSPAAQHQAPATPAPAQQKQQQQQPLPQRKSRAIPIVAPPDVAVAPAAAPAAEVEGAAAAPAPAVVAPVVNYNL